MLNIGKDHFLKDFHNINKSSFSILGEPHLKNMQLKNVHTRNFTAFFVNMLNSENINQKDSSDIQGENMKIHFEH